MDAFLHALTQHTVNFAIRSGIAITSSFAIKQCHKLLQTVDDKDEYQELQLLQDRLDGKIRIISPAIDMVELISARGNTTLESAVGLTRQIRWDIQHLGRRIIMLVQADEDSADTNQARANANRSVEIRDIISEIRRLLQRLEDAVPLINLAITTSGAKLSTTLPASVSPARLLQASTFLTAADVQFGNNHGKAVQVGPTLTLSLYMLFQGHSKVNAKKDWAKYRRLATWKEVIHKAQVKLMRVSLKDAYETIPSRRRSGEEDISLEPEALQNDYRENIITGDNISNEYAYRLDIVEDLDDGRVHTFEDGEPQPGPYGGVQMAGIRELIPVSQISKIFYADTGKILNINSDTEVTSPVLLLKRDVAAQPPRQAMSKGDQMIDFEELSHSYPNSPNLSAGGQGDFCDKNEDADSQHGIDAQLRRESCSSYQRTPDLSEEPPKCSSAWQLPVDLDPAWLALEVHREPGCDTPPFPRTVDTDEDCSTSSSECSTPTRSQSPTIAEKLDSLHVSQDASTVNSSQFGSIRSSLSLLEVLIRLTSLQQFQQASHLTVHDELLSFFLEDSSTPGGTGEERHRQRWETRQQVGFDPYNESPVKPQQPIMDDDMDVTSEPGELRGESTRKGHTSLAGPSSSTASSHPWWSPSHQSDIERRGGGSSFFPSSPDHWSVKTQGETSSLPRNRRLHRDMHNITSSPSFRQPPHRTFDRVSSDRTFNDCDKAERPLGRDVSAGPDSSLGTSPELHDGK